MYRITTTNGTFFYSDFYIAKSIMYVLQRENVRADLYRVFPEIGDLLLWHIG